jgi:DNA-binding MarR family transcriptional regulator
MSECVTMRVDKTVIQRLLRDEPTFSQMFVSHVLARTARVEEDLVDQLFNSTEKRLARLLLLLANFGKEGRPEPLIAKITQETLAEMIGTTRSRVSHFMNKFRQAGFIDYNGHLEVHSSLLSVLLAEQPRTVRLPQYFSVSDRAAAGISVVKQAVTFSRASPKLWLVSLLSEHFGSVGIATRCKPCASRTARRDR